MTPFDEEEERKRWSEMGGMSPGQLSTPQAESPESVAIRWLGGRNDAPAPAMAQPDMPEVPEPPMMQSNNGGIIAAAIADLVLNKGRSLGTLIGHMSTSGDAVAKENWQRQRQHALDQASISHQMREGRGEDPRVLAARERALELQARGLGLQERQFDARQESSAGAREAAIALGADPELVGKMSDQQVAQWKSAITGQLRQQGSNQAWDERYGVGGVRDQVAVGKEARAAGEFDRRTGITEDNKVAGEGRAVDRKLGDEQRAADKLSAEASIDGWRVKEGHAPTTEKSMKARELLRASGDLAAASNKMVEINSQLTGMQAKLGPNFAALIGDDAATGLLLQARQAHEDMLTAVRKQNDMGAPQAYELTRLDALFPKLEDVSGILTASSLYKSLAATANEKARRHMSTLDYEPDTGPTKVSAPKVPRATGGGFDVTRDDEWEDL
jgi:hypothetical protein